MREAAKRWEDAETVALAEWRAEATRYQAANGAWPVAGDELNRKFHASTEERSALARAEVGDVNWETRARYSVLVVPRGAPP
jgi:hypothetical protein